MLDLKSVSVHEPGNGETHQGRVYSENNKTYLEFISTDKQKNLSASPLFVKIFYMMDNFTKEKYSLVNLSFKSINSQHVLYQIAEVYIGDWICNVLEQRYNRCIAQMSGLSLFIDHKLVSLKHDGTMNSLRMKDDHETIFRPIKGLKVTFRKFYQYEYKHLSFVLHERSSLIVDTTQQNSRQFLIMQMKSLRYLLSIFLPSIPKLWEIEYRGKKVSNVMHKVSSLYGDEMDSRSAFQFTLKDLDKDMFKRWFSKQEILDEMSELLIAGRENIVPETRFTYFTKVLEICFKKLYVPEQSTLVMAKDEMVSEGTWDNGWQIQKKLEKVNFALMLGALWHLFHSKPFMVDSMGNAHKFLKKVHSSRNYYTHRNEKHNVFTEEELITVNNILQAFSYGLMLQFLGFERKKQDLYIKRFLGFLLSFEFDNNEYSIDYKKTPYLNTNL